MASNAKKNTIFHDKNLFFHTFRVVVVAVCGGMGRTVLVELLLLLPSWLNITYMAVFVHTCVVKIKYENLKQYCIDWATCVSKQKIIRVEFFTCKLI